MGKRKILIVEDEAIAAMALEMELNALGIHLLETVSSGEEAVSAALQFKPDLIFMDVHLDGEMSGIQAVKAIHSQHKIPIVYTTASQSATIEKQIQETDYVGFLQKPYLTVEITTILYRLFN